MTDGYWSLDVRRWQRDGLLMSGRHFGWQRARDGETVVSIGVRVEADRVILSYRHRSGGGEWKDEHYPSATGLDTLHLRRYAGMVHLPGGGMRVAKLYLGGRIFACRHCYQLVYESQREDASKRALRKAQRIRVRLGRSTSLADFFPEKPKGMHWCTYERRRAEAMDAEACSWAALAVKLERWRGQLG